MKLVDESEKKLWSEWAGPVTFTKHGSIHWTEREDQRLMNSYRRIPREKIMMLFPGRSWYAIASRACILRIPRKGRRYTSEEDSRLVELYYHTDLTYSQMSLHFPFRTEGSLRMRMYSIRRRRGGG